MGVRHASGSRPVWEVVSILISMHISNPSWCVPKFIGAEPLAKDKSGWMGLRVFKPLKILPVPLWQRRVLEILAAPHCSVRLGKAAGGS